jgi:hypothetical protein
VFNSLRLKGIFVFITASRQTLGTTQSSIIEYWGLLPLGLSGRGAVLTTHRYMVPMLRKMELHFQAQYVFIDLCLIKQIQIQPYF